MRITELYLDGLGPLKACTLSFAPDGLTLIVGPNEAGKSSAAEAIRMLLYGAPKRQERSALSRQGAFNGRLHMLDDQGQQWISECREQANGFMHRIQHLPTDAAMMKKSLPTMEKELLGGVNQEMHRRLYSISLDELHAIHTLQGEELRSFLYDSGFDAGVRLVETEGWLTQEMEKLYKPRGRVQKLHSVLQEMEQRSKDRKESEKHEQRLLIIQNDKRICKESLAHRLQRREQVKEQVMLVERAVRCREIWVELVAVQEELALLPKLERWQPAWQEQLGRIQQRLDSHEERGRFIERKVEQLTHEHMALNDRLLMSAQEIKHRVSEIGMMKAYWQEMKELSRERNMLKQELEHIVRMDSQRGQERTAGEPIEVSLDDAALEDVQRMKDRLSRKEDQAVRAEEEGHRAGVELLMAEENEEQAKALLKRHHDLGVLGCGYAPDAFRVQRLIRDVEDAVSALEEKNRKEPLPSSLPSRHRRLYPYLIAAAGLLSAGICVYIQQWAGAVLLLLISTACAGLMYTAMPRLNKAEQAADLLQYDGLLEELMPVIHALGYSTAAPRMNDAVEETVLGRQRRGQQRGAANKASKQRSVQVSAVKSAGLSSPLMYEALDAVQAWDHEREQLETSCRTVRELHKQCMRDAERARYSEESLSAELSKLKSSWIQWLIEHKLPEGWSPQAVLDCSSRSMQAHQRKARIARCEARYQQLDESVNTFVQQVNALFLRACEQEEKPLTRTHDHAQEQRFRSDGDLQAAMIALNELHEKLQLEEERALENRRLEAAMAEWQAELDHVQQECLKLSEAQKSIWNNAKVMSKEQFAERCQQEERRAYLEQRNRELKAAYGHGGTEASTASIEALLATYDELQLEQQLTNSQHLLEKLDQEIRDFEQQAGRLSQEEGQLVKQLETEAWHQRMAELESELDQLGSQYAVYSIARALIRKTRRSYEQEKQPFVLKRAGEYVRRMTNGQYVRLMSPAGTQDIHLERSDGEWIDSLSLSRGTAELVYLAMRFALIDGLSSRVSLPVIWDELFVNFDPERLRHTLRCIPELLGGQQMIWTTCHPYMVEAVKAAIPDAHIIALQS